MSPLPSPAGLRAPDGALLVTSGGKAGSFLLQQCCAGWQQPSAGGTGSCRVANIATRLLSLWGGLGATGRQSGIPPPPSWGTGQGLTWVPQQGLWGRASSELQLLASLSEAVSELEAELCRGPVAGSWGRGEPPPLYLCPGQRSGRGGHGCPCSSAPAPHLPWVSSGRQGEGSARGLRGWRGGHGCGGGISVEGLLGGGPPLPAPGAAAGPWVPAAAPVPDAPELGHGQGERGAPAAPAPLPSLLHRAALTAPGPRQEPSSRAERRLLLLSHRLLFVALPGGAA